MKQRSSIHNSDKNVQKRFDSGYKNNSKYFFLFVWGLFLYLFCFVPVVVFKVFNLNDHNFLLFKQIITLLILGCTGYHVIVEGLLDTYYDTKKNRKFTPNIHILMLLGALGAVFLHNFNEAILLIIIFATSNFLEEYIETRSHKEIRNLLKMAPTQARLIDVNGNFTLIEVEKLNIGDEVIVLSGDQIPSDGIVISGNSCVDESNITGESIPVDKKQGDKVYGSNINLNNTLIIKITANTDQNLFARIIKLSHELKNNVSKNATLIKRLEPVYVTSVLLISFLILVFFQMINFIKGFEYYLFNQIFEKIIVFLTVASPCALVVADIPATLSAISYLAKQRILLKNGNALSFLANIKIIVFDKTGTLTIGQPIVKEFLFDSFSDEEIKSKFLAIFYHMEKKSNHPLARSITKYLKSFFVTEDQLNNNYQDIEVNNLIGIGVESFYQGKHYRVAKYSDLNSYSSDNKISISPILEDKINLFLNDGYTVLYFSCDNTVLMVVAIFDVLRPECSNIIKYFQNNNIKTAVLTGDNYKTAQNVASYLNIDYVFAECLPEDKLLQIKELKKRYGGVAMVGDGVNDALALANADVGIALQEGVDAIADIADIVLMKNNLIKIIQAHKVAVRLNNIVCQNMIFAISVIIILTISNFFTSLFLPFAVFLHEISTILVLLNGLRMLKN
ncbi:heavy metal translocating P-type ATPase [Candidatus Phytoplasma bonamiae]|uniref:Heavy metal translocating P-type ATPase n=1 Tax=Candidatus Phytoplasma bonamiae TaxID=2982626 RepID=A0ABT9D435_9MOLU|nr:heavy metal translocating P-type ATPase ['Bonamia sp.' little leaf phytoplasma]MDO8064206.1 heavy metal translocating P-type ATPase ['Bonamia sp.' little leaf phytoplasma]MDV3174867.1 heavy metal translocating P-type ATPase ['Bonamia sp.' little leaf phytoplasma]